MGFLDPGLVSNWSHWWRCSYYYDTVHGLNFALLLPHIKRSHQRHANFVPATHSEDKPLSSFITSYLDPLSKPRSTTQPSPTKPSAAHRDLPFSCIVRPIIFPCLMVGARIPPVPALTASAPSSPLTPPSPSTPAYASPFSINSALEALWALDTAERPARRRIAGCPLLPRAIKPADAFDGMRVESGDFVYHEQGAVVGGKCPFWR